MNYSSFLGVVIWAGMVIPLLLLPGVWVCWLADIKLSSSHPTTGYPVWPFLEDAARLEFKLSPRLSSFKWNACFGLVGDFFSTRPSSSSYVCWMQFSSVECVVTFKVSETSCSSWFIGSTSRSSSIYFWELSESLSASAGISSSMFSVWIGSSGWICSVSLIWLL
jgi:hypothetical protein